MFGFFKKAKQIVGRREVIDLPEFNIQGLLAKIDTGAYRSAIHADNIREENGVLKFTLLDQDHPQYNNHEYSAHTYSVVRVKSSNGEMEQRYKIKTDIVIRGHKFETEFTLSNRSSMRNPVLIGRKALHHRFVVDISHT